MRLPPRYLSPIVILVVACLALPARATAQTLGQRFEGELAGNVYFGNTRQILAAMRVEREQTDSGAAMRTQLRYGYGQTTTDEAGTVVNKRSWGAVTSYDRRPFSRISPYVRALLESSFENRIARRYGAGGGARLNVIRSVATDVIASAGVDAEQTVPLPTALVPGDKTTLARGLTNLRLRRVFSPSLSAASEASYAPALTDFGDYTLLSLTSLKMSLSRTAGLTLTFRDGFDSRAVSRGARSNNDGELLLGVLTTF